MSTGSPRTWSTSFGVPPATGPLTVGAGDQDYEPTDSFDGAIDQVRTYGRALSPTEVWAAVPGGARPGRAPGNVEHPSRFFQNAQARVLGPLTRRPAGFLREGKQDGRAARILSAARPSLRWARTLRGPDIAASGLNIAANGKLLIR